MRLGVGGENSVSKHSTGTWMQVDNLHNVTAFRSDLLMLARK